MFNRIVQFVFGCAMSMLVGIAWAEQPDGAYLDGGSSKVGVILVHGRYGGHGDARSPVVNPLRIAIHERLGFHTLSLDYPQSSRSRSAAEEVGNFPAAYQRLDSAIAFLTKEKGVTQIYVMGHSLGSRITTSYLAQNSVAALRGYIGVGVVGGSPKCQEGHTNPLNTWCNLKTILRNNSKLPVIDVVAMADKTDVHFADERTEFISTTYRQIRIDGADHKFHRKEDEMVNAVVDWLKQQQEP